MKLADQARAAILMIATVMALGSALLMVECVYEGARSEAWVWAAIFFASCTVAAWCFRGLV